MKAFTVTLSIGHPMSISWRKRGREGALAPCSHCGAQHGWERALSHRK
ncbi:MAG: hypothetical protein ACE5LX_06285 [Nitrospinota bacterium]